MMPLNQQRPSDQHVGEIPTITRERSLTYYSDSEESANGVTRGTESEESRERDPEWCEQRIRVDKRKIDQHLQGLEGGSSNDFFSEITQVYNVKISAPTFLKNAGARTKKDPYLKIRGKMSNVEMAKTVILERLGTRVNKVTLKVDISHTEHSHIIGKCGNSIKTVMDKTKCHIHFPDSNRTNTEEKSNQVSIAGDVSGVEEARQMLRQLQQLEFSFELPLLPTGGIRNPPDLSSPVVQKIGQKYEINISVEKPRHGQQINDRGTVYTTKGLVSNTEKVKTGTQELIDYLTQNCTFPIVVQTTMDITPAQQHLVFGKDRFNLQRIINKTGVAFSVPEPGSLPPAKRGTVYIQGNIDSVVAARHLLISHLPVVFMFDVRDTDVQQSQIDAMMRHMECSITVKLRPRHASTNVVVKTSERNVAACYEVRRQLGFESEPNPAGEPSMLPSQLPYQGDAAVSNGMSSRAYNPSPHQQSAGSLAQQMYNQVLWNAMIQQQLLQTMALGGSFPAMPPPPPGFGMTPEALLTPPTVTPLMNDDSSAGGSPTLKCASPAVNVSPLKNLPPRLAKQQAAAAAAMATVEHSADDRCSVSSDTASSSSPEKSELTPTVAFALPPNPDQGGNSNGSSGNSGVGGGNLNNSFAAMVVKNQQQQQRKQTEAAEPTPPTSSSSTALPAQQSPLQTLVTPVSTKQINSSHIQGDNLSDSAFFTSLIEDYERKKIAAQVAIEKVMDKPEIRTPTGDWAGLGFSRSMPISTLKALGIGGQHSPTSSAAESPLPAPSAPWEETREDDVFSGDHPRQIGKHGAPGDRPAPPKSILVNRGNSGHDFASSNQVDVLSRYYRRRAQPTNFASSAAAARPANSRPETVSEILTGIGLSKYCDLFREQEISDVETLLSLTDSDLAALGITFGARRRLELEIKSRKSGRLQAVQEQVW